MSYLALDFLFVGLLPTKLFLFLLLFHLPVLVKVKLLLVTSVLKKFLYTHGGISFLCYKCITSKNNQCFTVLSLAGLLLCDENFLLSHFSVFTQVHMLTRPADARTCSVVFEPAAALANDP